MGCCVFGDGSQLYIASHQWPETVGLLLRSKRKSARVREFLLVIAMLRFYHRDTESSDVKIRPRVDSRDGYDNIVVGVDTLHGVDGMKVEYTYWKEPDDMYLGYLNEYPDHWTQGTNLKELKVNLADLHELFSKDDIPGIKKVANLELA